MEPIHQQYGNKSGYVYKMKGKNLYISPDIDIHNSKGVWKTARRIKDLGIPKKRIGTFSENFEYVRK